MQRECSLHADLVGNLANGECLGNSAALLCDYDTFKDLDTGLVALLDLYVYAHGAS